MGRLIEEDEEDEEDEPSFLHSIYTGYLISIPYP